MPSDQNPPLFGKKILIIHFRVGKTDGVSIEIEAWKEILTRAGAVVKLCSGPINVGADYVISNLEQQLNPTIYNIDEAAYAGYKKFKDEDEFIDAIKKEQEIIITQLNQILDEFRPDRIIISNIFSVGEHLPAAGAFTEVFDKRQIPVLGIHHDFWWENIRYKKPNFPFVVEQLGQYFPPKRPWLKHAVINSIAQKSLSKRRGVEAGVIYDTVNFDETIDQKARRASEILDLCHSQTNDIIVLQATRIVRRKNIEIAIDLINTLSKPEFKNQLAGKTLSNGKRFDPQINKIILILAGYAEKRDQAYKGLLLQYAKDKGVSVCYLGGLITDSSSFTLYDAYPRADVITYPSEYEGFGNQFLESIWAKKPVALFEYPVFKSDIAPLGFDYISLGDTLTKDATGLCHIPEPILTTAAQKIISLLSDPNSYQAMVEKNFDLGKENFSYDKTLSLLSNLLSEP